VSLDTNPRDEDESPALQIADTNPNPEEHLMRAELHRTIHVALLQIPQDQRTVVILSDIEGMSYDEIAEVTGANIGTVKSRLNRARSRLREIFIELELFPLVRRLTPNEEP
jgi:RNA polymerase sigma-70 factor (ECF subfamily)